MYSLSRSRYIYLLVFFTIFVCESYSKEILNPLDYGIDKAKNDVERYYILLQCHQDAVNYGKSISYKGINDIHIEIPSDAVSIPLSKTVDFCNVNLYVRNTTKEIALFALKSELNNLASVDGQDIDDANFTKYPELNRGTYLLVIEDGTPWVKNRKGYDYGASRRDIVVVVDGKGNNKPTASYNTIASKPIGKYCAVRKGEQKVKNLHFYRTSDSNEKTYLCNIQNQYNVRLENITITTPDNDVMFGDGIIGIRNCVRVTLNNIRIDGTYSQLNKFGYGVAMNNIHDLKVNRMVATAKWGVFGTNNMNKVNLKDCDINRFDIHCYGKNVSFERCTFGNLYNQFSSVYGTIKFSHCKFLDFIPILLEPSYNAYTGFDIVIKDCEWHVKEWHTYLIQAGNPFDGENQRPELRKKCWPNVSINKLKIWGSDNLNTIFIYKIPTSENMANIGYVNHISIKNIKRMDLYEDVPLIKLSNGLVEFENKPKMEIK
ncbi:hypothetical protein L6466_13370 [Prevotella communis]|uniref:hypothetical protein n=1 Tax=Prevotella communis TaxID=2913614 RepID=UPI001EDB6E67|nr:hypothetical protein [Prevotella communis]UKK67572.1 hypothetical protein L6464_13300 [Prevotella communis]UKK70282.1 hypothetical protein L6466_13370 [Prevotella communis]